MLFMRMKNQKECFTCIQCKQEEIVDFTYYPMCRKCKKTNTKLEKRRLEKEKKEKNS